MVINRGNFADYGNAYSGRYVLASWTKRVNKTYVQTDGHDLLPAHPVRSRTFVSLMCALFVCPSRWDRRGDGPHLCLHALIVVELR